MCILILLWERAYLIRAIITSKMLFDTLCELRSKQSGLAEMTGAKSAAAAFYCYYDRDEFFDLIIPRAPTFGHNLIRLSNYSVVSTPKAIIMSQERFSFTRAHADLRT
jgi:hypothetical protein